jgi:SAM-dependent methyltransferase
MLITRPDLLPERATCPLCDHDGAPLAFTSRDRVHQVPGVFGVYRCSVCEAIFIQPTLTETDFARFYPPDYGRYRHSKSLEKKHYGGWQRLILENYYGYPPRSGRGFSKLNKAAAFVLSFVAAKGVLPYRGNGRILDVGCEGGSYLYRLKQWGWETYGVEPSESGVKQARSLGLEVHYGSLAGAKFPNAFFDVIRLNHVLEHLNDPKETFWEINRILRPDGLVYVTVPNTRSLVFRLFGENWYALDAPRHVISYCPRTLEYLCAATGFQVSDINFSSGPLNLLRSMNYYFEENGRKWPRAIAQLNWQKSKAVRRLLKPFFFMVDGLGFGDSLHATLRKKPAVVSLAAITRSKHKKLATQTAWGIRIADQGRNRTDLSRPTATRLGHPQARYTTLPEERRQKALSRITTSEKSCGLSYAL